MIKIIITMYFIYILRETKLKKNDKRVTNFIKRKTTKFLNKLNGRVIKTYKINYVLKLFYYFLKVYDNKTRVYSNIVK